MRFVYKHAIVRGDTSQVAAEASECANEQGFFWDYHDKLFAVQAQANAFGKSNLKRYAVDLGLDQDTFNACLDSGRYAQKVRDDNAEAKRMGVQAVPTFFINGRKVEGLESLTNFRLIIEDALKKAQ